MTLDRRTLAHGICESLARSADELRRQWLASGPINHVVVDEVLPDEWARSIRTAFPAHESLALKRSLRELKYVTAQMDRCEPLLEEAIYAFQEPEVVRLVGEISGLTALEPDSLLYAGGISLMAPGHFLNPHIDNSHDKVRSRYRVLNLLYYVSPDWTEREGGNLELWPDGPRGRPLTIVSRFNRLVIMLTHRGSWHSVSRVASRHDRCCVSNYYFSKRPPVGEQDYFHVTSFRGRPDQPLRDLMLRGDIRLRSLLRRLFPLGVKENPHYYQGKR